MAQVVGFVSSVAKAHSAALAREALIVEAQSVAPLTHNPFAKLASLKIKVVKPKAKRVRKPVARKVVKASV